MDQECLIFVRAQYLFQKLACRLTLSRQHVALAQARVDEQSYNQGQVAWSGEVADRLRPPVFENRKIFPAQIANNFSVFVPHSGQDVEDAHLRGKRRA